MAPLRIESVRSGEVESTHPVHVAVVDVEGRLVASAGEPARPTWWRSSAKFFQALPLVEDGAADAFGFGAEALAIACASHSSEPVHLAVVEQMLRAAGVDEADLACGPHPPLSPAVAERVVREGVQLSARWSNCSGKHAGMLALARHRGWPLAGYARTGHPLQERVLDAVLRWTGLARAQVGLGVDGCTAAVFRLPLAAMARAYARFGASDASAPARLRAAVTAHPLLLAGTGRPCTELLRATEGRVIAKVGAEGVYCAMVPGAGLGVALKVESGDGRCAPIALLHVLEALVARGLVARPYAPGTLAAHERLTLTNTRAEPVGELKAEGDLRLH